MRVNVDADGVRKLLKTDAVKHKLKKQAQDVAEEAARNLRAQVKHNEPATTPVMAESFYVEERGDSFIVGNSDPDFVLIELGTHPGGGDTYIKYAPLRRALDSKGQA